MSQSSQKAALTPSEYNIGWITIKPDSELVAARLMLDEIHENIQIQGDPFTYYPGKIGEHNIVISCSGEAGKHQAAECAVNMMRTFMNIKVGLLSGIGGGVPSPKYDIRLGDVVVGMPSGVYGGVAVYDSGKMTAEGYELKFHLNCSPMVVRQAVGGIRSDTELGLNRLAMNLKGVRLPQYKSCDRLTDELYDGDQVQTRAPRATDGPVVHHGLIACGDWVVKDSEGRNELMRRVKGDVLCFEMEAAGLMNNFPCLVVRGISDYCDKHKNDGWHRYASTTAAAYCKSVLQRLDPRTAGAAETAASISGAYSKALTTPTVQKIQDLLAKNEFDVPDNLPIRNTNFLGRSHELHLLGICLEQQPSRIGVLHGAGGVGKTQTALQYAWKQRSVFTTVFLLDAANITTLRASFSVIAEKVIAHYALIYPHRPPPYISIAEALGLNGIVDANGQVLNDIEKPDAIALALMTWFGLPGNNRWLLIFDGYDDLATYELQDYLPTALAGKVIVTSRRRSTANLGQAIAVDVLPPDECTQLLLRSAQSSVTVQSPEAADALAIVTRLGRLPLAIDHAGSYVWKRNLELREYLPLLEANVREVLGETPTTRILRCSEPVLKTWETSYQALVRDSKPSANIMVAAAFMGGTDIPNEIFERTIGAYANKHFTDLLEYSFVLKTGPDTFKLHSMIETWARERLTTAQQREEAGTALSFLAQSMDPAVAKSTREWSFERRIMVHVKSALAHLEKLLEHSSFPSPGELETAITIADYYRQHRLLEEAKRLYQRILEVRLSSSDTVRNCSKLLKVKCRLGTVHRLQHRYGMAEKLFASAYGDLDLSAELKCQLEAEFGVLRYEQGHYDVAEAFLDQAIEKMRDDDGHKLRYKDTLASTLRHNHKHEKSEELYREVLTCQRERWGPDNPETLRTLQNLGLSLQEQGKLGEAREVFEMALRKRTEVLGPLSPSTLRTMRNLGCVLKNQGDLETSLAMYTAVIAGRQEVLGPLHMDTARACREIASIYEAQGDLVRAESFLERALAGYKAQPVGTADHERRGMEHNVPSTERALIHIRSRRASQNRAS